LSVTNNTPDWGRIGQTKELSNNSDFGQFLNQSTLPLKKLEHSIALCVFKKTLVVHAHAHASFISTTTKQLPDSATNTGGH
jgi:hypothetical protein